MQRETEHRVELKGFDLFQYFFPATVMAMLAAAWAWLAVSAFFEQGELDRRDFPLFLLMFCVFALLSFLGQWKLRRDLRFRRIETELSAEQSYARVLRMAETRRWRLGHRRRGAFLIYYTRPWWFGWGERVCVRFRDGAIWVSSICDPGRPWPGGVFGRHEKNVGDVKKSVA